MGKIPYVDSSWINLIILSFMFVRKSTYREKVLNILNDKRIHSIIITILLIIVYSSLNTILLGERDFSYITTLVHQIISAMIGVLTISYLLYRKANIIESVILSFAAQGLIQFFSMMNANFRTATNVFRPENSIIIGQWSYSGIRGLAISGSAFFGLAVSYGLIYIIWACNYNKIFIKKTLIFRLALWAIILFGGMSAGRTSLIGFVLAFMVLIAKNQIIARKSKGYYLSVIIVLCLVDNSGFLQLPQVTHLTNYVTEFFRNGKTTSSDELFHEMYFHINPSTLILGDGRYVGHDGAYYLHTDAGYMRAILYFGIPGLLSLLYLQTRYLRFDNSIYKNSSWLILLYILIVQIKGEVLGFSIMAQSILIVYLYHTYENSDAIKTNNEKGVAKIKNGC